MKKITAIFMVLMLVIGCLGACNMLGTDQEPTVGETTASSSKSSSSKSSSSKSSSSESSSSKDKVVEGTGDNESVSMSMTLFDVEYTVGESKLKDFIENGWGYDPDAWHGVDLDKEIGSNQGNEKGKALDNSTTEIFVCYKNYSKENAKPEDCAIRKMEFKGSKKGAVGKAGVKLFDGKIDLTEYNSHSELEEALNATLSEYKKDSRPSSDYVAYFISNDQGDMEIHSEFKNEGMEYTIRISKSEK